MSKKEKAPPVEGPPVVVEWLDANSEAGWMEVDKARKLKPTRCWTAGWVLKQTRKFMVVCSSQNEDDDIGEPTTIPRAWVVRVTTFKEDE